MSVALDRNISAKLFEKLGKYKDLEIEIGKVWHLKPTISVIVGTLGLSKKEHQTILIAYLVNYQCMKYKKIILSSTAHILRRPLSI